MSREWRLTHAKPSVLYHLQCDIHSEAISLSGLLSDLLVAFPGIDAALLCTTASCGDPFPRSRLLFISSTTYSSQTIDRDVHKDAKIHREITAFESIWKRTPHFCDPREIIHTFLVDCFRRSFLQSIDIPVKGRFAGNTSGRVHIYVRDVSHVTIFQWHGLL